MRTVKIVGETSTIKFGDTATDIKLQMFNDGQLINLGATSKATIRVRDEQVYIKSFDATIVDPLEDVVSFKSSNVTNLAPGNYYLEVVLIMEDVTRYVYPDSGFVTLLITQSATTTNGGLITTLTLQELLDQLEQWKKGIANSITELNANVSGINLTNTEIKTQLSALEDKIKGDDFLTNAPAFKSLQTQVDNSAVGTNLIQMSNTTAGYVNEKGAINNADSTLEIVTDFIEVESNQTYCMQEQIHLIIGQYPWFAIGIYDGNKTFISRQVDRGSTATSNSTSFRKLKIVMPENAKYVRVSFSTYGDENARVKFEKGSLATDWCPNPSEILTKSDYAKIQAAIVALGGSLS